MQGMQFRARDCESQPRKSSYIFSLGAREGHLLTLFYAIAMHVGYRKALNLSSSEYTKRYSQIPAFGCELNNK